MNILLANNAISRLSSAINASSTVLSVSAGSGAKFPSPGENQYFPVTVINAGGAIEIMKCTSRSGDVLTVVRAQEGTSGQSFAVGDRVELRLTAKVIEELTQWYADTEGASKLITADGESAQQKLTKFDDFIPNLATAEAGKGSALVAFLASGASAIARTVSDKLRDIISRADFNSDAAFNAAKSGKPSIDAANRLRATSFISGVEEMSGAAVRDAFVVGRNLTGLTDCHAFADRTIIDGVTDAGTYGVFDATTKLRGGNDQNHLFGYQFRCAYEGSNHLRNFAGFLGRPVHSGSGLIDKAYGLDIGPVSITGAGTVGEQIGVYVRDQIGATVNVGINVDQSNGYAYYASGAGLFYSKGRCGFGIGPSASYAVSFGGNSAGAVRGFLETTATSTQIGSVGDTDIQFISNGKVLLRVENAALQNSITPGTDNSQPIGSVPRRFSVVCSASGAINTSDAREKNEVRSLVPNEIRAAIQLAKEVGAYKFLASIEEKGELAREHIGMTVQRAIEIMESNGLDPFGYGFICYDKWEEETVTHPAQFETINIPAVTDSLSGAVLVPAISKRGAKISDQWVEVTLEAGDRYSFRTDELSLFIASGLSYYQGEQDKRIADIEQRLIELQSH